MNKLDPSSRLWKHEQGNAVVEYVAFTALIVIPIFYLIVCLASVQATLFATEAASRDAARMLARDPAQVDSARSQAQLIFGNYGIRSPYLLEMNCTPANCSGLGAYVSVTTSARVPLPLLPAWLGQHALIPVSSTSEAAVESAVFDEQIDSR